MNNKLLKNDESFESMAMMLMIIVGIAVIMGYLGTRYVVYPVFLKEEVVNNLDKEVAVNEQAEEVKKEEIEKVNTETKNDLVVPTGEKQTQTVNQSVDTTKSSFCVYHVQLGKFQEKSNAEVLIKELKDKDVKTYIVSDSGYKVVTMPVVSYEEAEVQRKKVNEFCKDAFVLKRNVMSGEDEFADKLFVKK